MQEIYLKGFSAQYIDEDYVEKHAGSVASSAFWRMILDYVPQFYIIITFNAIL